MKIEFSDHSYIEAELNKEEKVMISISAKDPKKPNSFVLHSCSLTKDEVKKLFENLKIWEKEKTPEN